MVDQGAEKVTGLDLIITLLCALSILRVVSYQRDGARLKRRYGVLAWIIICLLGGLAIHIVGGRICTDRWPIVLPLTLIFTLLIYQARGNVATVIRPWRLFND